MLFDISLDVDFVLQICKTVCPVVCTTCALRRMSMLMCDHVETWCADNGGRVPTKLLGLQ
jgi:hypothetical protein